MKSQFALYVSQQPTAEAWCARSCSHFLTAVLLVVIVSTVDAGIRLQALTRTDTVFSGNFIQSDGGYLVIGIDDSTSANRRMVAHADIRSLAWQRVTSDDAVFHTELARTHALWQFLDQHSMERLINAVEAMAIAGDWRSAYHHVNQMLELQHDAMRNQRLRILQAWFLFEMGLYTAAREQLDRICRDIPLLDAPLRLCWLAAMLARQHGDENAARRWAALPFLRIPAAQGTLADELLTISLQGFHPQTTTRYP